MPQACCLLQDMQAAGFRPDIRAYNILLKGCAQSPEEVARIPELLEGIRQAALEPSTATYNTLVDAYVNAGLLLRVSLQNIRLAPVYCSSFTSAELYGTSKGHLNAATRESGR